jgi:hypothetical protein
VFLCHHSIDKTIIKQIGEKLKDLGILLWLGEEERRLGLPGQWQFWGITDKWDMEKERCRE